MAGPYKLDSLIVLTYLKHIKIHTNVNIKQKVDEWHQNQYSDGSRRRRLLDFVISRNTALRPYR